MNTTASLTVTVENSDTALVETASVTLTASGTAQRTRLSRGVPGQYVASGIAPGAYELRLSARGHLTDTYRISLKPGPQQLVLVLGRRGERFYYAAGLKIYFRPVDDRFLVAVYGTGADQALDAALEARGLQHREPALRGVSPGRQRDSAFRSVAAPPGRALDAGAIGGIRADLEGRGLRVVPARIVQRGPGAPQGLTEDLVVQFAPRVSRAEAEAIAADVGLQVARPIRSTPNAFVLRSPAGPDYELLDVAQNLLDQYPVLAAEPDILMPLELDQYTPNDPLFNLQTHLPLIDCDDAWTLAGDFLGDDRRGGSPEICIAVFDPDGVAPNHPDLTANLSSGGSKLLTSFNFAAMAPQTVAALGGDHGTQCAGTATAAFDNNRGIAGVAPNCRLIGARLPNPSTGVMMADAFLWAAGIDNGNDTPGFPDLPAQPADVISNSWGVGNAALSVALQNAFDLLTDNGRDGRGCIVTFSTGNLGFVQFSNIRRFAAYERNVAVGASINVNPTSPVNSGQADPNGNFNNIAVAVDTRALYNPFGPEMDLVAPSHTCYAPNSNLVDPTTSTVRVGAGTLDGCPGPPTCLDYSTAFGGTSHASPTVAGSAALVLSIFPRLTWQEVRAILRRTAVRIDPGQANPTGQWISGFSQWYGFGRVDVAEAVDETAKLAVATYMAWR